MDLALLIFWMGLIFSLSTDSFSSAHTAPFSAWLLKFLLYFGAPSSETIDLLVRKAAHFSEYFIFGILLMNVLNRRSGLTTNSQIRWAIPLGIIYAMSDELHQSIVPSRTTSARDIIIDTIGLVCGIFCFYTYIAIREAKTLPANTHSEPP
jgi:VanZ family protein